MKKRSELTGYSCRFAGHFLRRLGAVMADGSTNPFYYARENRVIECLAELGLREYIEMQRRLGAPRAHALMCGLARDSETERNAWIGWSAEAAAIEIAEQAEEKGEKVPAQTNRKPRTGPRIIPGPWKGVEAARG